VRMASATPALNQPAPATVGPAQARPQSEHRQSFDIQLPGSSPVGPLGVLAALWLARRKSKAS
jgi:hypothetical protein